MTYHHPRPQSCFCIALIFGLSAATAFGDDDAVPGPPPPCVFTECAGTPEGEPCDDSGAPDTVNGGCNNTPAVFGSVHVGESICGTAWALSGNRDTDWYRVIMQAPSEINMIVTAEAPLVMYMLGGIENDTCGEVTVIESTTLEPCAETVLTHVYAVGEGYLWIGSSDFDLLPCGSESPGTDYILTVDVSMGFPSCCTAGDANEDGEVYFGDLLILLDNWGPCESPPCCTLGDSNEDGEVGFHDLITLLDRWGICSF